jgi:hydroxymethylpyrimidine pyrophosphatase-like HAD family hydrolase
MAVGDQLNDLDMIIAAGHGVAMGNAPDEVRSVARYVAPHVDEQGAARMIEELVLGRGGARG